MSYLRIPKVRVTISKLVDHILYDPFGIPNNRFLQDRIVISDTTPILIPIKGFRDSYDVLDRIVLNYIATRSFSESVTLTDASIIEFVTAVLRSVTDVASIAERPFLLQVPGIKQDLISIIDSIRLDRILSRKPEDTVNIVDEFSRVISAYRVFADAVGMIDNFTLIDGSTYTLDKGIRDFLIVGSDIAERVSNNAAENVAFFANKVLISQAVTNEQLSTILGKQLDTDDQPVVDDEDLWLDKALADLFELDSADQRSIIKSLTDGFDSLEDLAFVFLKSLTDTATMIDNLDLGDQLVYDSIKDLDDAFDQFDSLGLTVAKTADTDSVTQADDDILWFDKGLNSEFSLDSVTNYYLAQSLTEAVDTLELVQIFRAFEYSDLLTTSDILAQAFTRGLILADTATASNRKALGIDRFYFIKRPSDTADISEQLARSVRFQRSPAQGFAHDITEPDVLRSDLGIGVGSGSYRNVPLLRTNLIYFSENFGASYWEKFNTSIDSDSYPFPDLVYLNPSTTVYDPTYEAANIMEIFEGYQYRNPAGRASWFREAKLTSQTQAVSAGDLIIEDTTVGRHYVEATVEADLPDLEKFAFAVHLKPNNRRYVRIDVTDEFYAVFDINSGLVVGTNAESAQIGRASTDGWFLCSLTARLSPYETDNPEEMFVLDVLLNAPDNPRSLRRWSLLPSSRQKIVRISALQDSSLTQVYAGSGEGAFWAWGAQLETGDQVEQEISSLTYIKTVGGQASKYGFNIMPRDTDRVFAGSLHRSRNIWPTRLHNDENERTVLFIGKETNEELVIADQLIKNRFLLVKLDQQIDFSSTTVAAGTGSEFVFVGRQTGGAYDSGEPLENINRYMVKTGKRGYNADPAVSERWTRTNYITNSEDFRRPSWTKVRTISFRSLLLTSGNLPYRSTYDDASQVMELFEFPRPNTYYINRWYEMTPLSNLPDYTSNVVCDVYEQPLLGEHLVQTTIYDNNLAKDVFSYSVYASPVGGIRNFRLQVNNDQFADFDLSSVAVVSSSTNIYYSNIETIDSSNQVYLCRIIGPAVRISQTFSSQDFTDAAVVFTTSTNIIRLVEFNRVFEDTALQAQDNLIAGLVTDYMLVDGNEDYQVLSGAEDFQIG